MEPTDNTDEGTEELQTRYESERDAEASRWWKENHKPHISAWNPRMTLAFEQEDIRRRDAHLKRWTKDWFESRGYQITFLTEPKDAFEVEALEPVAA